MPRFDRYLLAQLTVSFGFFALVLVLIYWVNRAIILFDQLIADGQPTSVFLEFTALSLPSIIRLVLPIAAFAASLYVTHRLTEGSELTVAQATGSSPFRLARPVLLFGLGVTLLTGVLTTVLAPAANHALRQREAEIAETATARILRPGQFLTPGEGIALYIRDIPVGGELHDLFLSDRRNPDETIIYTAARAYLVRTDRGPQLVMVDGLIQTLRAADQRLITTSFTDLSYDIGGLITARPRDGRISRELPTRDLLFPTPAIMAETGKSAGALVAEGHDRFAQAILATVGAVLGFATLLVGGFSRFGVWRQVVAAIALIIVIKMVEAAVTGLVRDNPGIWLLIYLPSAIGGMIGALLLAWAGRTRRVPAGVAA